jgi:thymidylate synthase
MNNLDKQYTALLQDILDNGVKKQDRTGTGTLSVFGRQIRHKMSEGFPLLTTKKMYMKGIVTELLWFLRGDTNIKFLVDNDCHIWDGDAYKNWKAKGRDFWEEQVDGMFTSELGDEAVDKISKEWFINKIKTDDEFAKKWGDLGPIYGKQWRNWTKYVEQDYEPHWEIKIDQIAKLINDLKTNPDSRRLMVNAWNVGELEQMVLPPCHYGFQVYTRELSLKERAEAYNNMLEKQNYNPKWQSKIEDIDKLSEYELMSILQSLPGPTRAISLMWNQRSVDTFLGLPFNIASYGLLLEIIAKEVNMVPDELIGNLGDTHLYLNHIEQAKEQIGQPIFEESPTIYPNGPMNEGIKKQIIVGHTREPYPLPKLVINDEFWNPNAGFIEQIEHIEISDFDIRDYQSHPTIKAPLSN